MAWTIAIIVALLGLSAILILLNKSFDKSKQGIKVFLTLLCLATLILTMGVIGVIIKDKASSSTLTNLTSLSTTGLTITIALFGFFIMYFFITYLTGVFKALKDARKEKEELSWNAI